MKKKLTEDLRSLVYEHAKEALYLLKNPNKSKTILEKYYRVYDFDYDLLHLLGIVYRECNNLIKSIEVFDIILKKYKSIHKHSKVYYEKGLTWQLLENNYLKAVSLYEISLKNLSFKNDLKPRIYFRLGECFYKLNKKTKAKKYLLQCIKLIPKHIKAFTILKYINGYDKKNDYVENNKLLKKPDKHLLYSRSGSYYLKTLHSWDDAFNKFYKTSKINIKKNDRILFVGCCFSNCLKQILNNSGFKNTSDFIKENRYTTISILQDLKRIFLKKGLTNKNEMWNLFKDEWASPYMKYVYGKTKNEAYLNSLKTDEYFLNEYKKANVIIIALGLIEGWKYKKKNIVFPQIPFPSIFSKRTMENFVLDTNDNVKYLENIINILKKFTKSKIIFTISPIPLQSTFTNEDCVIADFNAKAKLRSSIIEVQKKYKDIEYFPALELLMYNLKNIDFFKEDRRHINNKGMKLIGEYFLKMYT